MKVYWAIGAALLVAGPIMALPSHEPKAAPPEKQLVVDVAKVGVPNGIKIGYAKKD